MLTKTIHHANLYTGDQILRDYSLIIENNLIHSYFPSSKATKKDKDLDAKGLILAHSFIDLQVYGAQGRLFNNQPDLDTLTKINENNVLGGTTQYLVTLSTSAKEITFKAIDSVRKAMELNFSGLLGLHLEGPFINSAKKGAHLQEFILEPNLEEIKEIMDYGKGVIQMMTIAPEKFNEETLRFISRYPIILSAGHSEASFEQALNGFNEGIRSITHLFNAMSPLNSREPGLVGAALDHHSIMSSIIPDGIHCNFSSLKIAKKIMGNRLFLITDSVSESSEGYYQFFKGDNKFVDKKGTLSGSALSMIQGVKNCVEECEIPLSEALRMASYYPAKLMSHLKINGRIRAGDPADLILFDSNYKILSVLYNGQEKIPT